MKTISRFPACGRNAIWIAAHASQAKNPLKRSRPGLPVTIKVDAYGMRKCSGVVDSIAAGAGLVAEAFSGAAVTGLPISLVLGGHPMLSSIWLFGNGLVCFHNGYKFFMMALADQEDVARVVRDIKGLLPAYEG